MKNILCVIASVLSLSSCYTLSYAPYNEIVLSAHTCEEGEEKLSLKTIPADERWKAHATLAECYADSAWLALSAINRRDDRKSDTDYISIDSDCREAREHFYAIPDAQRETETIVRLGKEIAHVCDNLVEKVKRETREDKRFFPGEISYPKDK